MHNIMESVLISKSASPCQLACTTPLHTMGIHMPRLENKTSHASRCSITTGAVPAAAAFTLILNWLSWNCLAKQNDGPARSGVFAPAVLTSAHNPSTGQALLLFVRLYDHRTTWRNIANLSAAHRNDGQCTSGNRPSTQCETNSCETH